VLVTGASGGIGGATARRLAALGATVVCAGRDAAALGEVAASIDGIAAPGDDRAPGRAEELVAFTLERCGRLDAVVASAGVGFAGEFASMPVDRLIEIVELDLLAPLLLTRAAFDALAHSAGSIVLVGSIAGLVAVSDEAAYSAAKAGLVGFAEAISREAAERGIAVSMVSPGVVDTRFFDRRGLVYDRRFPRPIPAERIAERVAELIDDRRAWAVEPRWLAIPVRIRGLAPRLYRRLSDRFG
jgi:short-subunit dehydrogenase